jgi:hypothetical protein
MGLSNASSRARNYTRTANQNQGGGNKKAGFPGQVGRGSWTSIFLQSTDPISGHCCTKSDLATLRFTGKVNQSRPIGARPNNYHGQFGLF